MLKPTLLSLSMLTVMSGAAVAPALAKIASAFPAASPAVVKQILTLPAVFIIVFALGSGRLSARFSKRRILCAGLVTTLFGGLGGGVANRIEALLLCRALLGAGVGLIMPLSTGLIADFYTGEERTRVMGYSSAASNLGGIVATLAAGALASLSWRFSFGVYALALAVLLLVLFYLPEPETGGNLNRKRQKLPTAVYAWAGGAYLLMLAFYAVPVNLAFFLKKAGLGNAATAGLALSLMTASGFAAGLSFAFVQKVAKRGMAPMLFGVMAGGYFILSQATVLSQVFLGTCMVGLGMGWAMPVLFVGATKAAGDGMGVKAMAVVSSLVFLGQFMSPVVLEIIGETFADTSARFAFSAIGVCFTALTVASPLRRSGPRRGYSQAVTSRSHGTSQ